MPSHPESNPHFGIPQNQEQHFQSPLYQYQHNQPPSAPLPRTNIPKLQDRRNQPLGPWAMLQEDQGQHIQQPDPPVPQGHHHPRPHSPHEPKPRHQDHYSPPHVLLPPPPHTTLKTRCFAGFWACFWIVIVLIGLVILITYLVTRPHKPQFDVANVTLNAAYLAPDVLLHADLTMQVKFTNPNRNAKVDFSYMVIDLYYGNTLIASQKVEPFYLPKTIYSLQVVNMVTSTQVPLPEPDMERLKKQLSYSSVEFEIKGVIRSRVTRGSILRYSYRQHVDCTFTVNGPPSGALTAKYCKIKG
ncbi:hypothetical protein LWI28_007173 [Acer negundo]|uniref:Late embryogenesis abundant protein LEA-2 subgroup domain-containing protein n=1 Tax=Acer negundo TaxID=4023 RepID=A0AAD5IKX3_ACENE|nr:hypothetical protein LWI28_007173 [Acer negundo]KAK4842731.1 hypothetical protein QYF36_026795 [Acer negundo]